MEWAEKVDIDLKNLELFLRVSEIRKIGRAGESFGLSPTNASQRIQQLESEVGITLFHRSTRMVKLTHDGEIFLEHAKRILDNVEETRNVFRNDAKKVQGRLRITVSASYGRFYVVPFILEFIKLYPKLDIEVDFNDRIVDLIENGYDLAIRIGDLQSSSLLARKLSDNPTTLVASPSYLKEHGRPKTPADLKNHVCLPFANMKKWNFRDSEGKSHTVSVNGSISLNWGVAISDLVEADTGIGLASYWYAGPALKSGKLVRVLPDYQPWPQTNIWAIRSQGSVMPARVKVFLDYIEQIIKKTNKERYGNLIQP